MRQTLAQWLLQVHFRYHMLHETIWIPINIVPLPYEACRIHRQRQLAGTTPAFTASRYGEILGPGVEGFVLFAQNVATALPLLRPVPPSKSLPRTSPLNHMPEPSGRFAPGNIAISNGSRPSIALAPHQLPSNPATPGCGAKVCAGPPHAHRARFVPPCHPPHIHSHRISLRVVVVLWSSCSTVGHLIVSFTTRVAAVVFAPAGRVSQNHLQACR